jgi:hypothetical protein
LECGPCNNGQDRRHREPRKPHGVSLMSTTA